MAATVLVYFSGALGDVILTSPALALVRAWRPEAHIHWIAPRSAQQLYPALYDSWTDVNAACVAELFSDDCRGACARHAMWRTAQHAVVFEHHDSVLVRMLARVMYVCAVDARPAGCRDEHYSRYVWRRTQIALGTKAEYAVPVPVMRAPREAPHGAYAIVHAGSGSPGKVAPPDQIWRICQHAAAGRPWQWLLLEGESDAAASAVLRAIWRGEVRMLRVVDLRELAWYLAHAAYYVGNDSGVSHLAGVAGARGTVLFGPTDPVLWRPLGSALAVERF